MNTYPGATPEFRVLCKADGTTVFQVRYVHIAMGYTSLWVDVPMVMANEQ